MTQSWLDRDSFLHVVRGRNGCFAVQSELDTTPLSGSSYFTRAEASAFIDGYETSPKPTTREWLEALDDLFATEETEGWRMPANRTEREYAARQSRMAVEELRYKITAFEDAIRAESHMCDAIGIDIGALLEESWAS